MSFEFVLVFYITFLNIVHLLIPLYIPCTIRTVRKYRPYCIVGFYYYILKHLAKYGDFWYNI